MKSIFRLKKKKIVRIPFLLSLSSVLTQNLPRIFMYHRFTDRPNGTEKMIKGDFFDWQLFYLKSKWNIVSLRKLILETKKNGRFPRKSVVLTIDDGYRDFYNVAYPKLVKYGLPATFFPTVNFIKQKIWLWPDGIHFALKNTEVKNISLNHNGAAFDINLGTPKLVHDAWKKLTNFCLNTRDSIKNELIVKLEDKLRIKIPNIPLKHYAAVSWDELKEMSQNRIEIGSHTMNHPILSQIPFSDLSSEIIESKIEIERHLGAPVYTFCYPNGRFSDLNEAVVKKVKEAGYIGAVVGEIETQIKSKGFDMFKIRRVSISNNKVDFLWKLSGMEYIMNVLSNKTKT